MFWGLSGLRRNNSWSFSICHGSESGGNVSASEVCSEVGCRISTCVDLCHQVRHHQTQLHYHHHNHHLSIEMTCQWQVYVVSLHSLQMAQTCSSHTSSCLLELMISQGLRRGRLPPPDTWGIGEEMGRLFVFFCTAQWLQSSFHVVSLQCASYNMRSLDLSWIFCINDGSFMNWRARSPSHGIHCWMIFGSKRRCYGQSLRQAIWCTASCFHTHIESGCRSLVLSFSSRHVTHVLLGTILRIERFIALFCAIKALRGSELFYSVEAKIAQNSGDFTFSATNFPCQVRELIKMWRPEPEAILES